MNDPLDRFSAALRGRRGGPLRHAARTRGVLAFAAILGCGAPLGKGLEPPAPSRDLVLDGEGYLKVYPNGLVLFVAPDPYTRLIHFDVRQRVGARDDPAGRGGLAHLVEHLSFRMPTSDEGTTTVRSELQQHGIYYNASTSLDATHFSTIGTSDELDRYFALTAKRLEWGCDWLAEEDLEIERNVVANEYRWRTTGVDSTIYDGLTTLIFPQGHAYHQTIAASSADLPAITREDVCAFAAEHYGASGTTVVVSGGVDPQEVLELANAHLGGLGPGAQADASVVPPPLIAGRRERIEAAVETPMVYLLYRLPLRFTRDYIPSAFATARLEDALAALADSDQAHVEAVDVGRIGGDAAPILAVGITPDAAENLDAAVAEALDAIDGVAAHPLSKLVHDRIRQATRLAVLSSVASLGTRSAAFAEYLEEGTEAPGFYGAEVAQIDALTPGAVQVSAERFFRRDARMEVRIVPPRDRAAGTKSSTPSLQRFEPSEQHLGDWTHIDPEEAKGPLEIPGLAEDPVRPSELTLDNGLRVIFVKSSTLPVMSAHLVVGGGTADAPARPEVAALAAALYDIDYEDSDANARMASLLLSGAAGDIGISTETTTYSAHGLSIYIDFMLAGLADRVVHGRYGWRSLRRWKKKVRENLERKASDDDDSAMLEAYFEALYGPGHPLVPVTIEDAQELRDIRLADILGFRSTYYRAASTTLIVSGGFDEELARAHIEARFGPEATRLQQTTWVAPAVEDERPAPEPPRPGPDRYLTWPDEDRLQTEIRVAFPLQESVGEAHAPLLVIARMLRDRMMALREHLGSTYGVAVDLLHDPPRLEIRGDFDSDRVGESLQAIEREVQKLRERDDFERQFAYARREVLSDLLAMKSDAPTLGALVAGTVQAGLEIDYVSELAQRVAALDVEAVDVRLDWVLLRAHSVTLLVGPPRGIEDARRGHGLKP